MKLLKLRSNNPQFKTLNFKDGLNILAGLQLTSAEKKTYNGIGKSFSLNLIHLLLGSKLDKNKQREKKIHDFLAEYGAFFLEFSHKGKDYIIEKNFASTHYFINNEKINQTNFPSELRQRLIGNQIDTNISFKQLLNIFARRYGGTYYSDIITQQGRPPTDYYQMYANLCLLGVDTSLVNKKADIKDKLNQLEKARKAIEDYECLLDRSNIKDLKDEINQLVKDKNEFVIAENYDRFKREADEETAEINNIRNEIHSIKNNIIRKLESLDKAKFTDVDIEKVRRVYDEAKFFFEDKVTIRLEQAQEFHQKLMQSRISRLDSDIESLKIKSEELSRILEVREKHRDSILKDLDSKGALEEYNSINERIRTLESEVQELEKFKKILDDFKTKEIDLELKNAKVKLDSIKYLNESKEYLESVENKFRDLVKRFYKNHGGALQVIRSVDAKYLFNIDAHVPRDGSQGVNEVKIFCYDLLLYQLNSSLLGFIAHDGCIFSEMDPRQKSMMFKVVLENIRDSDLQYFVNIGQSSLDEILDNGSKIGILDDSEKQKIRESVILELYDIDPSNWLFGISFG
jgi:uncharacterized protein YydD (DUF2326 family)